LIAQLERVMEILLAAILALCGLAAAAYVQMRVPVFTKGSTRITIARAILLLVGMAFGLTIAAYLEGRLLQVLAFLIGFGVVHMPATVILFIKGKRGEGKS
jgi:uncharacterized protein YacL